MTRPFRFVALGLALVLLSTPTAQACGELGMGMIGCSMPGMDAAAGPMSGMSPAGGHAMAGHRAGEVASDRMASPGDEPCHGDGTPADDCCDVEAAPDPGDALAVDSHRVAPPLDAAEPLRDPAVAPATPPAPVARTALASRHAAERFPLFAALLL